MLARHSLVWLHPTGWQALEASAPPEVRDAIAQWRHAGWPLVGRRQDADAAQDECCLGLALPPDAATGFKRRIGLRARRDHVDKVSAPMALADALKNAPLSWRQELVQLDAHARAAGIVLRVFGSLALQALTGRTYLRPASDIDLLFSPADGPQLDAGVSLLSAAAARLPLDGEIVFAGEEAVAWKEWAAARAAEGTMRVLSKSPQGVRLAAMRELRASLGGRPEPSYEAQDGEAQWQA